MLDRPRKNRGALWAKKPRRWAFFALLAAQAAACGARTAMPDGSAPSVLAGEAGAAGAASGGSGPQQGGGGGKSGAAGKAGAGAGGSPDAGADAPAEADASHDGASGGGPGIAKPLDGLRWELPCEEPRQSPVCSCANERVVATQLEGTPGQLYLVTLRLRGVVETKQYLGGSNDGARFQIGGDPVSDPWNVYALEVSSPAQTYYLNRGETGLYWCVAVDYTATVPMDAGATLRLRSSAFDAQEIENVGEAGAPFVIDGVAPAPAAYDGQFLQVDVLNVAPAP